MDVANVGPQIPGVDGAPDLMGKWTQGVGIAKDVAGIGLGVWNALETSKMNKFMKSYYGDQMDMARENFKSSARDYNQGLEWREKVRASAAGEEEGSDLMNERVNTAKEKYGASETF